MAFGSQRSADGLHFLRSQALLLHQIIDKIAVTLLRRHAPGGSVGLLDVAEVFQVAHLIADGGRRYAQVVLLGHRTRTDRFGAADVILNDCI